MDRADVHLGEDEVERLIERFYGLEVLALQKVRAVYKAVTPQGAFGFKHANELPDLPFIARCLTEIKKRGFERIPDTIPAINGQFLIRHGEETYFMEEWIDAEEVPKESYPFMWWIGTCIADFHRAAQTIVPRQGSNRFEWAIRKLLLLRAFHKIQTWSSLPANPGVGRLERHILDFLLYRCTLAYEYIKRISFERLFAAVPESAVMCHGGLHHKNMMLDKDNQIWLIDFETMVYSERVMDLAQFLQYHAPTYNWNPLVTNTFLAAYSSRLERPIHRDEWPILWSYLAFPRRLNNRMLRYFDNMDRPVEHLMKLKETVEQEASKEGFLRLYPPSPAVGL